MATRYSDWIRENQDRSGYGWVWYRKFNGGRAGFWHFWELEKFRDFVADNAVKFVWAMTYSKIDGSFYYSEGIWRPSSGARLAFFRAKAKGKVQGLSGDSSA